MTVVPMLHSRAAGAAATRRSDGTAAARVVAMGNRERTSDVDQEAQRPDLRLPLGQPGKRTLTMGLPRWRGPMPPVVDPGDAPTTPLWDDLGGGAGGAAPRAVQLSAARGPAALDGDDAQRIADAGFAGSGGSLPLLDQVQRGFGRHDVSGVRAHVGGAAASASAALGAHAYASGDQVAFAQTPDLFLIAHEAAHVVQQRGGVQLAGGVGREGDEHEQHADAVAERIVRGESAEALLDRYAGGGGSAVQASLQLRIDQAGAEALATARRTLRTADAEVLAAVTAQLDAGLRGRTGSAPIEYVVGDDAYLLDLSIAQARTLRGEVDGWRRTARSGAPVSDLAVPGLGGGDPVDRVERAVVQHETVHDFRGGFRAVVAAGIQLAAGRVGGSGDLEIGVDAPIFGEMTVSGRLRITVEHTSAGYRVAVTPEIGLGVLSEGQRAALLLGTRIEITAHDAETAADLISLGIERRVRAMEDHPPPAFVIGCLQMAPFLMPVYAAIEGIVRASHRVFEDDWSNPFWPWLAGQLWGDNYARRIFAEMRAGDSVETVDTVRVRARGTGGGRDARPTTGSPADSGGIPEGRGTASLGIGMHHRVAADDAGTHESDYQSFQFEFEGSLGRVHARAAVTVPFAGEHRPAPSISFRFGAMVSAGFGAFLVAEALASLIGMIIEELRADGRPSAEIAQFELWNEVSALISEHAQAAVLAVAAESSGRGGLAAWLELSLDPSHPSTVKCRLRLIEEATLQDSIVEARGRRGRVIDEWDQALGTPR